MACRQHTKVNEGWLVMNDVVRRCVVWAVRATRGVGGVGHNGKGGGAGGLGG